MALKAPIELLVLVFAARKNSKSWHAALEDDLKWMGLCSPQAQFTVSEWFCFARNDPSSARRTVRKVCDSIAARSLTLGEVRPNVRAISVRATCQCGKSFQSAFALDVHRARVHGYRQPAHFFAGEDMTCHCCLLQFGCRQHLVKHLAIKSPLCLLNTLLRFPPLSRESECDLKTESAEVKCNDAPAAFRINGPTWPVIDLKGDILHGLSRFHPAGSGRGKHHFSRLDEWDSPEFV